MTVSILNQLLLLQGTELLRIFNGTIAVDTMMVDVVFFDQKEMFILRLSEPKHS